MSTIDIFNPFDGSPLRWPTFYPDLIFDGKADSPEEEAKVKDGRWYTLSKTWVLYVSPEKRYVFLEGFDCDLASIPRLFYTITGLFPSHPHIIVPAVPHDHNYRTGGKAETDYSVREIKQNGVWVPDSYIYTAKDNDREFDMNAKRAGMNLARRIVVLSAIRSYSMIGYKQAKPLYSDAEK